ncbi:hypothetical protein DL240_02685 [Lujinxingia litoralis]|uniref:Class I SAM-dependent methyltransferase n=1 Tax=Lujinxingia litoralis TaxID=2211119 RepID=A0A328C939_9DELT|nr:hypothetical protein [Lujinxingia litoralis]RAL25137.1 hypothetical protein DL240_02685 [Lujinxingia litoralis]
MKRYHVVEFEDLPWFPSFLRDAMTRTLVAFVGVMGADRVIAAEVRRALLKTHEERIVDLGSGAGGVMPSIVEELRNQGQKVDLLLTDLYPNQQAIDALTTPERPWLQYRPSPLDATELSNAPQGLKTMINSFHHLRPEQAKALLHSAAAHRQPLLIYELSHKRLPMALWIPLLPISLLLTMLLGMLSTLKVRPLPMSQIVLTFLIPLIPLFYAWDGQASMMRMYSFDELQSMTEDAPRTGYTWDIKQATDDSGKTIGMVLRGIPTET